MQRMGLSRSRTENRRTMTYTLAVTSSQTFPIERWWFFSPSGSHPVTAVLVEHHEEDRHDDDDADHDHGVQHGVEEPPPHRGRVLGEGGVDAADRKRKSDFTDVPDSSL